MKCVSHGIEAIAIAVLSLPVAAHAQLRVLMSGGFEAPYRQLLPEFERSTGIQVSTASGVSQGKGPETIGSQLRGGTSADVVILSREGLGELIAAGQIVPGTDVALAQSLLGVAVRAGSSKPDISTVAAFTQSLRHAKSIAVPGSTSGIYLTNDLFPKLGLADSITVKVTARGAQSTAMVVAGEADMAIQPVSELLPVTGLDFVGTIPEAIQYVSVFSAAVVNGSKQQQASKRLIDFLNSSKATQAIRNSGMERPRRSGT